MFQKTLFIINFANISNRNTSIIGGAFDVHSKSANGTCFLVGNYFPRLKDNPLFSYSSGVGIVVDSNQLKSSLIGKWNGFMDNDNITFIFNNDNTGTLTNQPFNYEVNTPQAGNIRIKFNDDQNPNLTFIIIDLTSDTLTLKKKGKSTKYTFHRINN